MAESFASLLRKNYITLLDKVSLRGRLLAFLYRDGVITKQEKIIIEGAHPDDKKVEELLSVLTTKADTVGRQFCSALKDDGQDHVAAMFEAGKQHAANSSLGEASNHPDHTTQANQADEKKLYTDCLKNNRNVLATNMTLNGQILNKLFGRDAITRNDLNQIESCQGTTKKKTELLLDILEKRRARDIKALFEELKEDEDEVGALDVIQMPAGL